METIMSFLTVEKVMYFLLGSLIFTVILFLLKQFFKFLVVLGIIFTIGFFLFSSPSFKDSVSLCVQDTLKDKHVSPFCKLAFDTD